MQRLFVVLTIHMYLHLYRNQQNNEYRKRRIRDIQIIMRRLLIALFLAYTNMVFASSVYHAPFFSFSLRPTIKGRVIDRKFVLDGPDAGLYSYTILVLDDFGLCVPDTITLRWSALRDAVGLDRDSKKFIDGYIDSHRRQYLKDPENYNFLVDPNADYYFVLSKDKADQTYWMDRHFEIRENYTYCSEGYFTERLEKKKETGMPVKTFEKKLRNRYRICIDDLNKRISVRQHDFVDLGLSVKWATCNIGADEPWDEGGLYAWGEHISKYRFECNNYWLCVDSCNNLTKYNTKPGFGPVDSLTVLEQGDDVAQIRWGGSWRMPSVDEWKELRDNCTWTLDMILVYYGYSYSHYKIGYGITSNIPGYTERFIFLPIADYWSRDLNTDDPSCAFSLDSKIQRCKGLHVRPVCP